MFTEFATFRQAVRRTGLLAISLAVLAALISAAPASAQNAYVPNGLDGTVSVMDTDSNMVTATINLSLPIGFLAAAVAVNPIGTRVYVSSFCFAGLFATTCPTANLGAVSVINTTTNSVITTIPLANVTGGLAVSPDGTRVYVTNSCATDCTSSTPAPGSLSVIDTKSGSATENTAIANISLADALPLGALVSLDGSRVYVTSVVDPTATSAAGAVTVIDAKHGSIIAHIDVGYFASGAVLNPSKPRLYVSTSVGIAVINTSGPTPTLIGTPPSPPSLGGIAITPDGSTLYAATIPGAIGVFDATQDSLPLITDVTAPTATFFGGLTAHPDGTRIYAADLSTILAAAYYVDVIQTSNNTLLTQTVVGTLPVSFGQFIPQASIQGLIDLIESFNLKTSLSNYLISKLQNAQGAVNASQNQSAVSQLRAFMEILDELDDAVTKAQDKQLERMTRNVIAALTVHSRKRTYTQHKADDHIVDSIQGLIQVVISIDHTQGIPSATDPKLATLQAAQAAAQAGQKQTAVQGLQLFITQTQTQLGSLTSGQVAILVNSATKIMDMD